MLRLEVSGAVRSIYASLGFKGLIRYSGISSVDKYTASRCVCVRNTCLRVRCEMWLVISYPLQCDVVRQTANRSALLFVKTELDCVYRFRCPFARSLMVDGTRNK